MLTNNLPHENKSGDNNENDDNYCRVVLENDVEYREILRYESVLDDSLSELYTIYPLCEMKFETKKKIPNNLI